MIQRANCPLNTAIELLCELETKFSCGRQLGFQSVSVMAASINLHSLITSKVKPVTHALGSEVPAQLGHQPKLNRKLALTKTTHILQQNTSMWLFPGHGRDIRQEAARAVSWGGEVSRKTNLLRLRPLLSPQVMCVSPWAHYKPLTQRLLEQQLGMETTVRTAVRSCIGYCTKTCSQECKWGLKYNLPFSYQTRHLAPSWIRLKKRLRTASTWCFLKCMQRCHLCLTLHLW